MTVGQNVLVTGVSRGLGLAITRALLDDGWTVYGVSRTKSEAYAKLEEHAPGRVKFWPADLSRGEPAIAALFGEYLPQSVPVHALVNNAAEAYDDLLTNAQPERLARMFATNVFAPMLLTKQAIRNMLLHQTRGSIVHVSSVAVRTGFKGLTMYAATKGALEAFSKNVAREWGGRGIRSNCVAPGYMDTAMNASLTPEQREKIHRRTALQTAVQPESVAGAVAYLLSERAASVTGQTWCVDGGAV